MLISSLTGMTVGLLMSGGDIVVPWYDAALCAIWGAALTGGGYLVLLYATRHVSGAETTFLMMVEIVLAPVWVWLAYGEVPRWSTLVGGAIILVAVTGWAWAGLRSRPPTPAQALNE